MSNEPEKKPLPVLYDQHGQPLPRKKPQVGFRPPRKDTK